PEDDHHRDARGAVDEIPRAREAGLRRQRGDQPLRDEALHLPPLLRIGVAWDERRLHERSIGEPRRARTVADPLALSLRARLGRPRHRRRGGGARGARPCTNWGLTPVCAVPSLTPY